MNRLVRFGSRAWRRLGLEPVAAAVVAEEEPPDPRGVGALGYIRQVPADDRYLLTRAELPDQLAVRLGRRIAGELVFGDVPTWTQDDLQRVTDLTREMVHALRRGRHCGPRVDLLSRFDIGATGADASAVFLFDQTNLGNGTIAP